MRTLLIVLFGLLCFPLFSQNLSVGLKLGGSIYQGDLPSYSFSDTFYINMHPSIGIEVEYYPLDYLTFGAMAVFGKLSGHDKQSKDPAVRERNLSFESNLKEFSAFARFYPVTFINGYKSKFDFYLGFGIGVFNFNPKGELNGVLHELQPLGTEGQGLASYPDRNFYSKFSFSIPLSVGVKYYVNENLAIGLNFGTRLTFTDYIDDVSLTYPNFTELEAARGPLAVAFSNPGAADLSEGKTRGGKKLTRDFYSIGGITVSYTFSDGFSFKGNGGGKYNLGCPTF